MEQATAILKFLLQHPETVLFLLGVAAFGLGAAGRMPPVGGKIDMRGRNLLLGLGLIFMLIGGVWWYVTRLGPIPEPIVSAQTGTPDPPEPVPTRPNRPNPNPGSGEIILAKYPQAKYHDFYSLHTGQTGSRLQVIKVEEVSKFILRDTIIIEKNLPYLLIEFIRDSTLFTRNGEFKLYFKEESAALFKSPKSAPEGWQEEVESPFYFYRAQTRYLHPFKMLLK